MPRRAARPESPTDLRLRALSRLTVAGRPSARLSDASAALEVLHALASSPATAADALALLHELQVHQVEVDMQAEEFLSSRAELDAALRRQIQLYDCAPVGYFSVDGDTTLHELNLTGAELLGGERDALRGRRLDSFVVPASIRALREMLVRRGDGPRARTGTLQLLPREGRAPRVVLASVGIDPGGTGFLVVFSAADET